MRAQFAHNGLVTELIFAAPPPAPEPSTNYFEVIGIPLLVAVITSIATAYVANRRSRNERIATMRLAMYRDLVILSKRWDSGFRAANQAEVRGEDPAELIAAWEIDADKLMDQMNLLPIIAKKRASERIEAAFTAMAKKSMEVDTTKDMGDQIALTSAANDAMQRFIDTVVEEGRKDIRRTGV